MEKPIDKHSNHYFEKNRNIDQYDGKTRTGGIMSDSRVPKYYKGKEGYEARKVCDNFDLPYHLATATTYIIRAYHKHQTPVECLTKAIAHLQFELEKVERNNKL
jgi:hypothetical protein|tara:strand:+ start:3858 stop:4169 length:312 start_codon:yes stop_codon:yes gene_type:complete